MPVSPHRLRFGDRRENGLSRLRARRGRNHAIDEAVRVVDEHSRRRADASRTIRPPEGSAVAAVTCAASIAFALASIA